MVSLVNVVVVPLRVVVLGLLHEGLRVVIRAPRCDPCHSDETDYEVGDLGDGAPDRCANSGGDK